MDPIVVILLVFILFCLFMIYYTSYQKSKIKKNLLNLKNERNATLFITLSHFYGLPIAENTITQIFSCSNEYEFLANNNSFKLAKEKVTDISITNDVDIQKNSVSSIGGAIGGAMLFGPVGAMIGGRAKEKTSKIIHSYLIFTFMDNGEIKYIAFNCTGDMNVYKFVKEFNSKNHKKKTTINL